MKVETGFFFECSDFELVKLSEIGGGDPSKGLRSLLENKNTKLADVLNGTLKDMASVLVDAAPQILTNFLSHQARGKK